MEAISLVKYPILLEKSSDLGSMGLGPLRGFTSLTTQRDRNAIPVLSGSYDKDDEMAKELKPGRIIVTSMGPKDEEQNQMFRISSVGGDELTSISVQANHIVGDLAYNLIKNDISIANATPAMAFDAIKDALVDPMPQLWFTSNIRKVANLGWSFKDGKAVTNLLMGEDQQGDTVTNTMQALYQGEWDFDNYWLKFTDKTDVMRDTGIVIKYGRRLKSLSQDTNIDNTYNAIMPYSFYDPSQEKEGKIKDYDASGVVQYIGTGGALTYDSPFKGHHLNGTVQNGSYYHVNKIVTSGAVNDDTWYEIGNNQWIDQHFFSYDKSRAYIVNPIKAKGTIRLNDATNDTQGLIVDFKGVGTIEYAGNGKVPLWTSPFVGGHESGQYISNGSSWKIYKKAIAYDGMVWYCLGNDNTQWVPSQYFSLQKTGDYATTPTIGILNITKAKKDKDDEGVVAMSLPGTGNRVNWNVGVGSKWKITQTAKDSSDNTWYQVSAYIWVKNNDYIDFKATGTVTPDEDSMRNQIARATGRVPIYHAPNGTEVTHDYLTIGTQKLITAQAQNQDRVWYEIGTNQWVDSSFFSFSGDTDVPPGQDDSGTAVEIKAQEETIMLPELVMRSPFTSGNEQLRIKPVDFSSYGVEKDINKLRMLASTYMKQYRIGYPTNSFTITYQQVCNEVDLYDLVKIHYEKLDIMDVAEVSSVTWDALADEFTSITLGQLPVAPEHLLGNYIQNMVDSGKAESEKRATHLFGEMKQAMELKNADQDAAMIKLSDELGMDRQVVRDNMQQLKDMVTSINATVSDVHNWISSGGGGIISAYPNWQNPTELRAQSKTGGYMRFNSDGLEYVGRDGVARTAIDSQGRLIAERITGGTITGIKLEGITVDGNSYLRSIGADGATAVMSGSHGFSYTSSGKEKIALDWDKDWAILRLGSQYLYASDIAWIRQQRGGRIH